MSPKPKESIKEFQKQRKAKIKQDVKNEKALRKASRKARKKAVGKNPKVRVSKTRRVLHVNKRIVKKGVALQLKPISYTSKAVWQINTFFIKLLLRIMIRSTRGTYRTIRNRIYKEPNSEKEITMAK